MAYESSAKSTPWISLTLLVNTKDQRPTSLIPESWMSAAAQSHGGSCFQASPLVDEHVEGPLRELAERMACEAGTRAQARAQLTAGPRCDRCGDRRTDWALVAQASGPHDATQGRSSFRCPYRVLLALTALSFDTRSLTLTAAPVCRRRSPRRSGQGSAGSLSWSGRASAGRAWFRTSACRNHSMRQISSIRSITVGCR